MKPDMGRYQAGASTVAGLRADPEFLADLAVAKKEAAAIRTGGLKPPRDDQTAYHSDDAAITSADYSQSHPFSFLILVKAYSSIKPVDIMQGTINLQPPPRPIESGGWKGRRPCDFIRRRTDSTVHIIRRSLSG